jgi:hypothetical protein
MPVASLLLDLGAAQQRLDDALDRLDADAILLAATAIHAAVAGLAAPGVWHDHADIGNAIAGALKRIESCRLRVMFMADHGARRVEMLTRGTVPSRRWRPDRLA